LDTQRGKEGVIRQREHMVTKISKGVGAKKVELKDKGVK